MYLKRQIKPFWVLFLFLISSTLFAQQRTVTGKIVSQENAQPLAGVSIQVKNTATNTLSNEQGNFSIVVPSPESILVISHVGFGIQEIKVGTQTSLTISMTNTGQKLDEVVVIGYGQVKRRDLTGSVFSVKGGEVVQTPTFNAVEAIQGKVPGVDITRSSGAAGAGANIRVRGNRSFTSIANEPLYIIDGYQGGNINDINPNDIESLEVLKDASATAIYGAQGANGVIIVTTKKGAEGKTRVSFDSYYGTNGYTKYPGVRIGEDYIQLRREAWRANGEWSSPADDAKLFANNGEWEAIQAGQWVDWIDLVNQNGHQQSHTVSVRGGNDKTKAYLSAGIFQEEGMLRNNEFTRYNVRLNLDQKVTKWFTTGLLSQVTYYKQDNRRDPLSTATSIAPLGEAYDSLGNISLYPLPKNTTRISPLTDERGPYIARDNNIGTSVSANGYIDLKPLKGLTFRSNLGTNFNYNRRGIYNDATSLAQVNTKVTTSSVSSGFGRYINWDNILTYTREFNDHSVTLTGITSYIQSDLDNMSASGNNQIVPSQLFYNLGSTDATSRTISSGFTGWNNIAYAGRLNYSYKGKYLLQLTQRWDGASRLAPDHKWDAFPSASVAWNLSQEKFMDNINFVNNLKMRLSYGVSGNYGIAVYGTQSGLLFQTMGFGDVVAPAYIFNPTISSPDLGWEKSATANIGLDFSLFTNRLAANIDLYQTKTSDVLYLRSLPPSTGVRDVNQNVGETRNRGIEIALTSQNIMGRDFNWNTTLTFTKNKEEITKLVNGKDIISSATPETMSLLLGRPINSFYTYEKLGIWQTKEADEASKYKFGNTPFQPGDIKMKDINGDSIINTSDRTFIGAAVPKFVAGLQNNFRYKGFDLGIFLFVRYGQMINAEFLGRYNPSGEGNGPAMIDYWTPENPTNDFPRPKKGAVISSINGYQTLTFVDGSYFKIRNVTLGYTLPKALTKKVFAESVRVYATGSNILTIAKSHLIKDYDPERGGAESTPLSRQFVFGVNLDF
ncbi:TonB-dependent receptor [Chitinophagaceae bacterium LB-8]|uniref:TonB-dependent receptor n=1 Tax=Paraflavisolibacter caeni TaxID=2982496 RepID=A0A9X2XZY3_9BACT|nr:TonB-dependent receptor [Paraflavisolibacter caeni]MCU7552012.1 TonB-dependent receptor [Paraflavisolibacter caeni]